MRCIHFLSVINHCFWFPYFILKFSLFDFHLFIFHSIAVLYYLPYLFLNCSLYPICIFFNMLFILFLQLRNLHIFFYFIVFAIPLLKFLFSSFIFLSRIIPLIHIILYISFWTIFMFCLILDSCYILVSIFTYEIFFARYSFSCLVFHRCFVLLSIFFPEVFSIFYSPSCPAFHGCFCIVFHHFSSCFPFPSINELVIFFYFFVLAICLLEVSFFLQSSSCLEFYNWFHLSFHISSLTVFIFCPVLTPYFILVSIFPYEISFVLYSYFCMEFHRFPLRFHTFPPVKELFIFFYNCFILAVIFLLELYSSFAWY